MASSRIQFSTLILLVILVNISTEALAKKPLSTPPPPDETSTTLNNKQALNLAKAHLTDFQAVDPEFTLKQLKNYILSLNTTSPTEIEESLQSYLLSLQPAVPNKAPTISGSPITSITEGESYAFAPSTSDPDGDNLTFSIFNKPTWAIFNTSTGNLYGTPGEQDIGSYIDIQITVSDGTSSTSLMPFSLTVEPVPTPSSTTLSWIAPTTRADGAPLSLSEINGYRIYMGATEAELAPVMDINDHTVNEYTLTNLATGTYYFCITVYDTDGNESSYSNIILKSML
ncbi:MAG: hypothetical protein KZQ80_06085 [Candidatus Thiodiazotropha sp. (ex Monitilora ramsayi)]|nr:hypothetical protein [Candidatus Thiodiazotropha sp. (ex Monitilora ramsayi)]